MADEQLVRAIGLGGQRPIYFPDYELLVVFTGWNILPNRPSLSPRVVIERMLDTVNEYRAPKPQR